MTAEFDYFNNRNLSKAVDLILQLGSEVHVLQQRVRIMQMQLERQGLLQKDAVDFFVPTAQEQVKLDGLRDALMERLMAIMTEAGPAEAPLREQWEQRLEQRR